MGIEKMLRRYLLQIWFNPSDPATEDVIYDSYAMRKSTGIDFMSESVPDESTLCKFRHLLEVNPFALIIALLTSNFLFSTCSNLRSRPYVAR